MRVNVKCGKCGHAQTYTVKAGPRPGSITEAVYRFAESNPDATRVDVVKWALAEGVNPSTALTQFGHYRTALNKRERGE